MYVPTIAAYYNIVKWLELRIHALSKGKFKFRHFEKALHYLRLDYGGFGWFCNAHANVFFLSSQLIP